VDKPGAPLDEGDLNDPNGAEAPDASQLADPRDDGVTDPANPDEPEEAVAGGTRLDTHGRAATPRTHPAPRTTPRPPAAEHEPGGAESAPGTS
jgi:hypothetical protein